MLRMSVKLTRVTRVVLPNNLSEGHLSVGTAGCPGDEYWNCMQQGGKNATLYFHSCDAIAGIVLNYGISNTIMKQAYAFHDRLWSIILIIEVPCATCMHQWITSVLVQIMACCLFGAKPIHSRKCIWKYRLQNDGFFVQGEMSLKWLTWSHGILGHFKCWIHYHNHTEGIQYQDVGLQG